MTPEVAARPEILKLARLLRRSPEQLAYLEAVPADDLRQLREQVTDVLFDDQGSALGRLAAASRLLPIRIVALIGERAFGALLAARITGLLDPDRAAEMAATMPVTFLADVAVELDPRRAQDVIARIPSDQVRAITEELIRRREYVTMGRFVGHLAQPALRSALSVMSDVDLLRVGFVIEAKDNLDSVVALLTPRRLGGIVDAAARADMWVEVLDLLAHVGPEQRERIVQEASAAVDDGTLASLVQVAVAEGLWRALLPLVESLPPESQRRVAQEVDRLGPERRAELERQARDAGQEHTVELLVRALEG